jgi:large subunit ribosomal protein L9
MQVYLFKDVPRVGFSGEIIKVSDGYAKNFLLPRKLGVEITDSNKNYYQSKVKSVDHRKEALATETSMRAEQIKGITIMLTEKVHDDGKLYGAISQQEIVDALAEQHSIKISKSQVVFGKSVKSTGLHKVTIRLSSRLQPELTVKVVAEKG